MRVAKAGGTPPQPKKAGGGLPPLPKKAARRRAAKTCQRAKGRRR